MSEPDRVENKAVVRQFHDAIQAHDLETLEGVYGEKYTFPLVLAEGEHVVVEKTLTATHKGEFMGVPATGREIDIGGHATFRIEDGRIAEITGTTNSLRALVQLGVLELPLTD